MASLTTVIPNYNHGHAIGRQLEAIFSQSVQPQQLMIVDDASTDDSVARIRELIAGRDNVRLICRQRNAGVVAVTNEALDMASTEYITFPGADDVILPGLYEKSLRLLERHPGAALCSAVSYVEHGTRRTRVPAAGAYPCSAPDFIPAPRVRELLLRMDTWMIGTTVIHRRRCLMDAGGFRPELRSYADGFAYLVMALRHGACFIPEPLAVWRREEHGYSSAMSRDQSAMTQLLREADRLMAGKFAELFPPKLRGRLHRRLLFRALSGNAKSMEERMHLPGFARLLQALLFCALRFQDLPAELRSRLGKVA